MNITCQHCKTKLNIPDQKISKDKESVFKCPKCKERIIVPAKRNAAPEPETGRIASNLSFEDRQNALVCIDDPGLKKNVFSTVKGMGFNTEIPMDTTDALERMEYHVYHLVVADESFDENKGLKKILDRMDAIDMSLRRRICLILVSSKHNSYDHMSALHASVNNIIHKDDIPHLESFLTKVLTEHKNFYTVYNDSLKQAGKA